MSQAAAIAHPPHDVPEAELAVLEILWEQGPATRRQITDQLYPGGSASAYTTVQKLLQRLDQRPPTGATVRQVRALMMLEMIGDVEARRLVEELARGEPDAWLTREARLVQQRLVP